MNHNAILNHNLVCIRLVVVKVIQVVEVADHQLHDLGVVASVLRITGVRLYGFELDDAALALLSLVSERFEILGDIAETYLERVCPQRRPEVLRVCADDRLVDLEVVWAADDSTVRVFFALEVA